MPTILVAPRQVSPDGVVEIVGEDAHHLTRSLRMHPGDTITVVCSPGKEHLVRLDAVSSATVLGRVVSSLVIGRETAARVHLLQAIPKGHGMGEVCERVAELGVASVWPVLTERTVPRFDGGQVPLRQVRWQRIAREAAQLAGRHVAPAVNSVMPLEEAVESTLRLEDSPQLVACASSATAGIASFPWDPGRPTALVIGPEGGLTPGELEYLEARGARTVSLGRRNLRTILAATVAVAVLLSRAGDLEV